MECHNMKTACIIPVFNTPPLHLMEAVNSVIYQNGVEVKIILIDDGSTNEGTKKAIKKILNSSSAWVCEIPENKGTPSALNSGHSFIEQWGKDETEYVFLMGSSDISHPDRFRLQLEYMQKHPETDVLGTWLSAFKDDADKLFRKKAWTFDHPEKPSPGYREGHDKFFIVNHGTVCYKQSSVMAVGGYDPKWLRAQDVNLWSRMHANGAVFRNITQVLYAHRR
jgi:glycosyltransferase involved in cell wall biosynthesis